MQPREATAAGAGRAVLWPVAVLAYLHTVWTAFSGYVPLYDFPTAYHGASHFLQHQPVYADPTYGYPPSAPLLTAPLGLLSLADARVVFVTLSAFVLVPLAGLLLLRTFDVRPTSLTAAALLLGLAVSETLTSTLSFGNLNGLILLGEAAFVLGLARDRDGLAGGALGLTLAVKPVLAPLVLLPVLLGRWRAVATAIAVPAVLSAVALPFLASPSGFFTAALPNLLHSTAPAPANGSVTAVAQYLHAPHLAALGVRALAVLVTAIVLWRLHRRREERVLWLGCATGILMLGAFLSTSLTEAYWFMYALPLAFTVVLPRSPMRLWPAWVGVYVATSLDNWSRASSPTLGFDVFVVRPLAGYAIILATVLVWSLRAGASAQEQQVRSGQEAADQLDATGQRLKAAAVASS